MTNAGKAPPAVGPDAESRAWLDALRSDGRRAEEARRRLHEVLIRAARFEIDRRRAADPRMQAADVDDLAQQAANDALVAILAKLDEYRGESRFATWAYKFVVLEAAVKSRRRAWQDREVSVEPDYWSAVARIDGAPDGSMESREVLSSIGEALGSRLSPHQRGVLTAVVLDGVPIDVLAERLDTTRGALYKTIHDARRKLRDHLADAGLRFEAEAETSEPRR